MTRRRITIILSLILISVAAALVLPAVYVALNEAPTSLVDSRFTSDGVILSDDLEGTWIISENSIVGYRVSEQIGLSKLEGVGRTKSVEGSFVVENGLLTTASFEVDMTTFVSDRSQRDDQFRGRIMDTVTHPISTFVLSSPVEIPKSTDVAAMEAFSVKGELTLRGVSKMVTIQMFAAIDEGRLRLTGSTEIIFSEWNIPNPSLPAALIFTANSGELEFDLVFEPKT